MSFLEHIDKHIEELKKKLGELRRERFYLFHDCDCDFCDQKNTIEDEERLESIDKEIANVEKSIESVKGFAKLHKIEVKV